MTGVPLLPDQRSGAVHRPSLVAKADVRAASGRLVRRRRVGSAWPCWGCCVRSGLGALRGWLRAEGQGGAGV